MADMNFNSKLKLSQEELGEIGEKIRANL
jgi:hypothetical protein